VTASQWKGLIEVSVAVIASGAVLTIGGSLKGYRWVEWFGEVLAVGGLLVFLVARVKFSRGIKARG